MNLSIVGTGYVGLVSGVGFAALGHTVICVDINETKVNMINHSKPPIYEQGLEELLKKHKKNIKATTDLITAINTSDITFICVGTPSNNDGSIDLTYIKDAAKTIGQTLRHKKGWHLVVVKSTVVPGTTQNIVLPLLEKYSQKRAGTDFGVGMTPEFLKEGVAVHDFFHPDRIVLGTQDPKSATQLKQLFKTFTCPTLETSLSAAEMIKYASNAFLATKISFINEIGNMCKSINIDTYEVAEGMGHDHRIGRAFLNAGLGWGGSCFPKDVKALLAWAHTQKNDTHILNATITVNDNQPTKMIQLLKKHLPHLKGKTIGILGLAFKPDTDDIRESRAIPLIQTLIKEQAIIKAYDPMAMNNFKTLFPTIHYCTTAEETLTADATLIVTKWEEFTKLNYTNKLIIDGRRLDQAQQGIYEGICW